MQNALNQRKHLLIRSLCCLIAFLGFVVAEQAINAQQPSEASKSEQRLITVPVIVTDKGDSYVSDLKQDAFSIYEDGVKQQIALFAPVNSSINVVLLLGTGDCPAEKIRSIQRSANEFIEFVEYSDRVKVISFDTEIHELSDFTSSQPVLRKAINSAEPGRGTKLYEAFKLALKSLEPLKGRKAIAFFTDGVDMNSVNSSYEENIKLLEESGVIVYPIRYDSRADKERLVRDQMLGNNTRHQSNDTSGGATQDPRYPSAGRMPFPRPQRRYPDRYPDGSPTGSDNPLPQGRMPNDDGSAGRIPEDRFPDAGNSRRGGSSPGKSTGQSGNDTVKNNMDKLYSLGDAYLNDIAAKSGGEVYRADNLTLLPDAFARVASEFRNQYTISYYSTNKSQPGLYRKIQVKVNQKDITVRTRPGYRESSIIQ